MSEDGFTSSGSPTQESEWNSEDGEVYRFNMKDIIMKPVNPQPFEDIIKIFCLLTSTSNVEQMRSKWHWHHPIMEILHDAYMTPYTKIQDIADILYYKNVIKDREVAIEIAEGKYRTYVNMYNKLMSKPGAHKKAVILMMTKLQDLTWYDHEMSSKIDIIREMIQPVFPELFERTVTPAGEN